MRTHLFQSTPAIADGRTWVPSCVQNARRGFNPRPPSLTGERVAFLHGAQFARSFNPRPPSLTGELLTISHLDHTPEFQSTPAIADGRTCLALLIGHPSAVSIHARHR